MSSDRTTKNASFGGFEEKSYEIICGGFIVSEC